MVSPVRGGRLAASFVRHDAEPGRQFLRPVLLRCRLRPAISQSWPRPFRQRVGLPVPGPAPAVPANPVQVRGEPRRPVRGHDRRGSGSGPDSRRLAGPGHTGPARTGSREGSFCAGRVASAASSPVGAGRSQPGSAAVRPARSRVSFAESGSEAAVLSIGRHARAIPPRVFSLPPYGEGEESPRFHRHTPAKGQIVDYISLRLA